MSSLASKQGPRYRHTADSTEPYETIGVEKLTPIIGAEISGVDLGRMVNPNIVQQQIESNIVFGIQAALYGNITLENGRVQQTNFHQYQLPRISETPKIETYIVPSTEKPSGVGEPGVPPLAPAVANAVAKLGGQRVRRLPFTRAGMVET